MIMLNPSLIRETVDSYEIDIGGLCPMCDGETAWQPPWKSGGSSCRYLLVLSFFISSSQCGTIAISRGSCNSPNLFCLKSVAWKNHRLLCVALTIHELSFLLSGGQLQLIDSQETIKSWGIDLTYSTTWKKKFTEKKDWKPTFFPVRLASGEARPGQM